MSKYNRQVWLVLLDGQWETTCDTFEDAVSSGEQLAKGNNGEVHIAKLVAEISCVTSVEVIKYE